MTYDSAIHHRRSIRLMGYDYSSAGAYFVTICTQKRKRLFGEIVNGEMWLNDRGVMVANHWKWLEERYGHVMLDEYIIMPNHLHGIIVITDRHIGIKKISTEQPSDVEKRKPLGRLIGVFKTVTTNEINESMAIIGNKIWQRNFWEHIIRNEHELNLIRAYIRNNPAQWLKDTFNSKQNTSASSKINSTSGGSLNWNRH